MPLGLAGIEHIAEGECGSWFWGVSMRIERRFTIAGEDPYKSFAFKLATSEIRNPDGSRVFHLPDCEVPTEWSQVACDILAQKYFRKAGIAAKLVPVVEERRAGLAVAQRPRRGSARETGRPANATAPKRAPSRSSTASPEPGPTGAGRPAISTARRMPAPITTKLCFMLAKQMAAPNSPQWFNTGLHWAYGIDGPAQGHYYVDFKTGELVALDQRL